MGRIEADAKVARRRWAFPKSAQRVTPPIGFEYQAQILNRAEEQYRIGLTLLGQNRFPAAVAAFERATRLAPTAAPAHHMLGIALQRLGQIDEAEAAITRAIGYNSQQPDYFANRSIVRCGQRRFDDAVADAEVALRLSPGHIGALCNLGMAHLAAKRFTAAAAAFFRAVETAPNLEFAHRNLSFAIGEQENVSEALEAAETYLRMAPDSAMAHSTAGDAYLAAGDSKAAVASFKRAAQLAPGDLRAQAAQLSSLNYVEASDDDHIAATSSLRRALAGATVAHIHRPIASDAIRQPRIGLVSGDLREHSVSQFLLDLLPHLRARGLWLGAYQTLAGTDEVTTRLKPHFELWRDISQLSDEDACAHIRNDRIDILFDLSGHTRGGRQRLFSMRPAPIAVSWLGYSATTANPSIDYILCNEDVLPVALETYFTERPLRLPGPYLCFSPPPVAMPEPVSGGRFTFGSFNTLNKLSDRTVSIWSRILAQAPECDLILKTRAFDSPEVRQTTAGRFASHGIDPARILMLSRTATQNEHLKLYGRLALALDPWPYSGTTTTMEALSMGVPVLTMNNGPFISRVSATLLSTAGLDGWIATDEDDYVRKAVAAAGDPDRLASIRPEVRRSALESPLCDPAAFSADFERAIRDVWRQWCTS